MMFWLLTWILYGDVEPLPDGGPLIGCDPRSGQICAPDGQP